MNAKIEHGLQKKFERFRRAARDSDAESLRAFSFKESEKSVPLDSERLAPLREMAGMPLSSAEEIGRVAALAASYLPDTMWTTVVVCGEGSARLPQVRGSVAAAGVPLPPSGRYDAYLAELGMMSLRLPPLPGFLEFLSGLDHVRFMGDGDRPVGIVPPHGPDVVIPMGPIEAMFGCMMGGEELPEDLNLEDGSVRIAVIDSGIDPAHPLLQGRIEACFDLSEGQIGPVDPDGHGTHVAGIIAGLIHGAVPQWGGIAPFARLTDIQLWSPLGVTSLVLIAGIGCAIQNRVDMFNLSMGTGAVVPDGRSLEVVAVEEAARRGILGCIAVGNDGEKGEGSVSVPSDAPSAVAVGAVHADGTWASFSSMGPSADPSVTGPKPTLAAPGVGIISLRSRYSMHLPCDQEGLYVALSGTSMAAPVLSGICALGVAYLKGKGMDAPAPAVVREALCAGSRDRAEQGANRVGAGIPEAPGFLRELDRRARKPGWRAESTRDLEARIGGYIDRMSVRPVFSGQGSTGMSQAAERAGDLSPGNVGADSVVAASPGRGPASGLEHTAAPDRELLMRYREMETGFIQGVRTNLEQYASDLAADLLGANGTRLGPVVEDDEFASIRGKAAAWGLDSTAIAMMPHNAEFTAELFGRGRRALLRIAVKSFAAWEALGAMGPSAPKLESARVSAYMQAVRARAGDTPCVFSLLAPAGWPAGLRESALSGGAREVLLCEPKGADTWFDVVTPCNFWYTWLAMTPMPYQRRIRACLDFLLQEPELKLPGGLVKTETVAEKMGLSPAVTRRLLAVACSGSETRFALVPDDKRPSHVKRLKILA